MQAVRVSRGIALPFSRTFSTRWGWVILIIQAQISIHFQGHQCTPLFPICPDMFELGYCPLSSPFHPISLWHVLFLYLPSSFFTYHPLSLLTILFLCCTVLVLHHPLSLPIILFLDLLSSFFAVLSSFYKIPSSFFTVLSILLTVLFSWDVGRVPTVYRIYFPTVPVLLLYSLYLHWQ